MTVVLIVVIVILAVAVAVLAAPRLRGRHRRARAPVAEPTGRRILFPFVKGALSQRALEAALRLARSEGATLVPVFLARVALDLPLDTPLPRQCSMALPLLEAVEHRATEAGVPVDSRIERGRNRRHALRQALASERYDRIVIAAAANGDPGFDAEDVAWLLDNAKGEIVVLRPSETDESGPAPASAGPDAKPAILRSTSRRGERGRRLNRAGEMAVSR
jgi:hypothetical protein